MKKTGSVSIICIMVMLTFSCWIVEAQQKSDCQQIIDDIFEDPSKVPPLVYLNSGKFINDLGDYNSCVFHSQDGYSYATLRVITKGIGYQYMGFCLPNQCTDELISNKYSADLQGKLNQIYKQESGKDDKLYFNLYFYNPKTQYPQADWSNYVVIAFILGLVLFGVAASIIAKISDSQSLPIRTIKCFSVYDNLKKIIAVPTTTQNQNLLFLNGTRVLSIFWIVFGHDIWFRFMNIKNWLQTINILTTPGIPTLTGAAYFAVDTFLWLGAFLVTLGLLQQLKKGPNYVKFYFFGLLHRFVRIWPTYLVAILMFWKIAPLFGSGPIWNTYSIFASKCDNFGALWNLLFIDNFMDHGPNGMDYCFGWGWYLAVDFQLFLIAPLIMMVYTKNKKIGVLVTCLLLFASVLTAFIMVMVNDWRYPIPNPKFAPQPEFMDKFYYKPYIRASAYMMGILTGFLYFQWKNKNQSVLRIINSIKNSIVIRILFYIVGITLVEGTIWIITPFQTGASEWSTVAQAFYNSLNRIVFLFGMFLCIFSAMFGCKNDPAKFVLGHPFFSPLAKVSFCIYLTHFIVIMDGTFSVRMDLYWEPMSAIYVVICDIFWSTLLATCLSVMVQSPILGLQKIFLHPAKKGKKKGDDEGSSPQMKIQFKQDGNLRKSMISNDSVNVQFTNNSSQKRRDTVNLM